ncbi:MAG: hypothetical protein RL164_377 [Bacteroidota bacterium]|jgi:spore coat polysaccharide biosynthesis protein SpsF
MNEIKLGIVIQARTGSNRLPNKILLDFFEGKSIIELLIEKIKINFCDLPIILATSVARNDRKLVKIADKYKIFSFQGNEKNVLLRFIDIVNRYDFTHIIRICSDNPFMNMEGIRNLIKNLDDKSIDYLSYCNSRGVPVIRTHLGLFAEVVSVKALNIANNIHEDIKYQEHVTNYIYENPTRFSIKLLPCLDEVFDRQDIRLTLDDNDDFKNLSFLYKQTEYRQTENLKKLIDYIDQNIEIKNTMLKNINRYTK